MSKLYELASLIPKAIANIDKVIEGNYNSILLENGQLSIQEAKEIARRRAICEGCPLMSENAKKVGFTTRRTKPFCTACGCPIKTLTASLSSECGIHDYNDKNPNNILPLKWIAYEKPNNI